MAKVQTKKKSAAKAKPKVKAKLKPGLKSKSGKVVKSAAKKVKPVTSKTLSKKSDAKVTKSITASKSAGVREKPEKKKLSPFSNGKNHIKREVVILVEKKIKKFKPNKKVKYNAAELRHFREIIIKERKAIIESAKANMDALVDKESGEYKGDNLTYSSHMAEQGTDEMEREKNYMFVQRDEKYLGYLQDALIRIDQGTYGICVDCKDHPKNLCRSCPLIQKERLELVPITQHCIECKNLRG